MLAQAIVADGHPKFSGRQHKMDKAMPPPWNSLPLEQYVLSQWESSLAQDIDQRRRSLAEDFVRMGDFERSKRLIASRGIAATVDPPEAEWSMILSPLRTELQRRLALPDGITGFGVVWLRTCYDDDEAYAQLFARLNTDVALESFSNVLDDGELYDFGEDWSRIFNFIPERLLGITTEYEDGLEAAQNRLGLICDAQKEYISGNWDWAMMEEIEQGHLSSGNYQLTGEEKRSNFYKQTTVEIHRWATVSYILIADKKALETGEVLLVYFDDCGRTVRWKRMDPQDGEPLAGAYFDGLHVEMPWFLEAHIGRDYLPGGVCGPPFELQEE